MPALVNLVAGHVDEAPGHAAVEAAEAASFSLALNRAALLERVLVLQEGLEGRRRGHQRLAGDVAVVVAAPATENCNCISRSN